MNWVGATVPKYHICMRFLFELTTTEDKKQRCALHIASCHSFIPSLHITIHSPSLVLQGDAVHHVDKRVLVAVGVREHQHVRLCIHHGGIYNENEMWWGRVRYTQ